MANRNSKAPVAFEHIVLKDAVPHAPAEVQAVLAVVACQAFLDQRTLRAAARVQPEPRVVLAHTVADDHIVRLLEAQMPSPLKLRTVQSSMMVPKPR